MDWHDISYHWIPPTVGAIFTVVVGIFVRRSERRRQEDEARANAFRADMKNRVDTIRKQNGWFIRKFIELSVQHNIKHGDVHINVDDYPNGFKDGGD
jgi:hypothetical protein